MKAFYITQPHQTEIRDIPMPTIGVDDVLLKIRMVGYCGSDLNTWRGKNPMVTLPRIPGHEVAATIEKVGANVPSDFKPGLNTTLSPYSACGQCPSCRRGRVNACQFNQTLGVQRDGAMTQYLAIPWKKLYPSSKLSLRELAVVEPLTVGFHAADRGRVTAADTVCVLGCGAIGLGAIAGAAFRKSKVIAVDLDDEKLALAQRIGACHVINTARQDLHQELQRLTQGGPDVVIEAIGLPATFKAAVEEVAFTGRVVYIGYAKEPVSYETKLFVQKELDVLGSRNALGDFAQVITMLEQKGFPADALVSSVVPLRQAGQALVDWDANPGKVNRILVDLDQE
jgi:threonine dehydrogenase-like Zn-dependent dehydrogenase